MLQRVVWNLKLNVFSPNDGQFRVYCIALSNVNQPAQVLKSGLNLGRRFSS